jgi:DeoR/GlpR family transcriptional regulator of sugar metabolism
VQVHAETRNFVQVLTAQRRAWILDLLRRDGQLVAKQLATELDLSDDTIRRDLRELAAEGKLQRVHGGALPASPAIADFSVRRHVATEGKTAVGRAAAALVQPGQTVIIDGGTTAQQVVRHLPPDLGATVITHSPTIACELVSHPSIEVLVIGGRLFKHSIVTCGAIAIESILRISADAFFMGVTGVHPTAGLTTGDAEEAAVKRALSRRSAETYVLASSEKIGTASPFTVMPMHEATAVIIESSTPDAQVVALRREGVELIRAG